MDITAFQSGWVDAVPEISVKWLPSVYRGEWTASSPYAEVHLSTPHQLNCSTALGTYDVNVSHSGGGRRLTSQLRFIEDEVLDLWFMKARRLL
jgi:hypothetical protein